MPAGTPALVWTREEQQVRDETVRRLVPLEAIARQRRHHELEAVTVGEVAERLGVTAELVEQAVLMLARKGVA